MPLLVGSGRQFKTPSLQALVENRAAVTVPPKCLYSISTLVEKEEQMSVEYAALEDCFDSGAEPVKTFTQINGLRAEEDLSANGKT